MNWSAAFSWFSALRRQRSPNFGDSDPAEMGTAFGLDASFEGFAMSVAGERELPRPTLPPLESRLIRRSGL
jgi:hypothetical protein